jgi:hypothetical protein
MEHVALLMLGNRPATKLFISFSRIHLFSCFNDLVKGKSPKIARAKRLKLWLSGKEFTLQA